MYELTNEQIRSLRTFIAYENEKATVIKLEKGKEEDGVFIAEREEEDSISSFQEVGKVLCIFGVRICAVLEDILYLDYGNGFARVPYGEIFSRRREDTVYRIYLQ